MGEYIKGMGRGESPSQRRKVEPAGPKESNSPDRSPMLMKLMKLTVLDTCYCSLVVQIECTRSSKAFYTQNIFVYSHMDSCMLSILSP